MAFVSASMLIPRKAEGNADVRLTTALTLKIAPAGAVTGLAAVFFGIGGGFLIVPGLMAATGMTLANAAASSLVSVVLFGAATSACYAASGLVDWHVFMALVGGGAIGSMIAIPVGRVLAERTTAARTAFALMVLATAVYVGWRALA